MLFEDLFKQAYVIHTGKKEHVLRLIGNKKDENKKNGLESLIATNELPHEIFSNPVPEEKVLDIVYELNKRFERDGVKDKIQIDVHWHDSKRRIIVASGEPDMDIFLNDVPAWDSLEPTKSLFICKKIGRDGKKKSSGDRYGLNSPTKLLRQKYPFGTIVNIDRRDNIWWPQPSQHPKKIDLDYLMNEPWAAWDLEFWHQLEKQIGKDSVVFSAPYFTNNSNFGNYILTYFDMAEKEIRWGDFLIAQYEPKIKDFMNYVEKSGLLDTQSLDFIVKKVDAPITKEFGKLEYEHNPLFLFGHNINNDKKILKNVGNYFPSVGGKHVVNKAHVLHQKEVTFGRETIDTYQEVYQKGLGMTESLESELIRIGVPFLKGLDLYGILHHLYTTLDKNKSEEIRKKSARIINEYAIVDSYVSAILGRYMLKDLLLKSYMFQTSPSDVCLKREEKLGEEKELRTIAVVNKFHDSIIPDNRNVVYKKSTSFEKEREKQLFGTNWKDKDEKVDTSESITREIVLWERGYSEDEKKRIKGTFKKGVFENCCIAYLSPFVGALKKDILNKDLSYEEIFNDLNETKDPVRRYYLMKAINQGISPLVRLVKDYRNLNMEKELDKIKFHYFKKRYSNTYISSPQKLYNEVLKKISPKYENDKNNLFHLIRNSNFIGFSRHGVAYFQPNSKLKTELNDIEKERFISILGWGNVLSFDEDVFDDIKKTKKEVGGLISLESVNPTYQDIVFKKSSYTLYERSFIREFLKYSLTNPKDCDGIFSLVKKGIDTIIAGEEYNAEAILLNPPGSEHLFKGMVRKREKELRPEKTGYYGLLVGDTKDKNSEDFQFLKNIDKMDVEFYKKHFYNTISPFAKHFLTDKQLWELKNQCSEGQLTLF